MEKQWGVLDSLCITVLIENYAEYDQGLLAQHGIALLVEARHKRGVETILVDCGLSAQPVLHNMAILGKKVDDVGMVLLSHCHADHTGGLVGILEASGRERIPVVAHPDIFRSNFIVKPKFRSFGMGPANSREKIECAGGELILVSEPLPLAPGLVTSGEIIRRTEIEKTPTLEMWTLAGGAMQRDYMADDLSLVAVLPRGLVIVTGCAHAGIVGIAEAAVELTGVDHILTLVGGFHLVDAAEDRIGETVKTLAAMGVEHVYTGHCTGLKAEAKLLQQFEKRFRKLRSGLCISF